MKQTFLQAHISRIALLAVLAGLVGVLAGCTIQPAGTSTDENAAENRQYMAFLNQKTSELDEVLSQFQSAVAAEDAVGMKASASDAEKVIEAISSSEATEALVDVKDAYVAGLTEINSAMNDYVSLYADVASGEATQRTFDRKIKIVQETYDQAVEKLKAADETLTQLANE